MGRWASTLEMLVVAADFRQMCHDSLKPFNYTSFIHGHYTHKDQRADNH